MRPLGAHCHFSLGRLYRRYGASVRAERETAFAMQEYERLAMNYWNGVAGVTAPACNRVAPRKPHAAGAETAIRYVAAAHGGSA
jgi:hypothetical protein